LTCTHAVFPEMGCFSTKSTSACENVQHGKTRGGIPFGRGALSYFLRNHFFIGEVKYKAAILPEAQPAIIDKALFEAVQQKAVSAPIPQDLDQAKNRSPLEGSAVRRCRPSHLLITSRKCVGCSNGTLAGLAPFKIRSARSEARSSRAADFDRYRGLADIDPAKEHIGIFVVARLARNLRKQR
jgi:hypothetical protein